MITKYFTPEDIEKQEKDWLSVIKTIICIILVFLLISCSDSYYMSNEEIVKETKYCNENT